MRIYRRSRAIYILVLSLMIVAAPYYLNAAPRSDTSATHEWLMSRIVSVTAKESKHGTIVHILGDGRVPDYITRTINSPPRIVVDIPVAVDSFESTVIPGKTTILKGIRIGHHPGRIRVVLDIEGSAVPVFRTISENNGISLLLRSRGRIEEAQEQKSAIAANSKAKRVQGDIERLITVKADDGGDDTAYLLRAIRAYRAKRWQEAIENLDQLITMHQSGRYAERAYFLLARSYEKLYSDSVAEHFGEIKRHYESAINRFPGSIFATGALLAMGDLCSITENYLEALGYYNLVIKKGGDSAMALHARMQKVKILLQRGRKKEVMAILEHVVDRYPGTPEEAEAKITMSKIAYEMNHFRKSISYLTELIIDSFETVYQHPEISLYLGYNYYQLGENRKARENLLRFYNSCPEREINHLVLANIADAYRVDGLAGDAVKFYRLVLERYPDTEGALISLIRLAEQQEEGKLEIKKGLTPSVKVIGREIGLPKEIYEDVMNHILTKGKESPLAQLALLKLAIIYQGEGEYDKSLEALKELLKGYPNTSLKKECRHVMSITLNEILKGEMKKRRYGTVVNTYFRAKGRFSWIDSPDLYLHVARAFQGLELRDMATGLFEKAEPLLSERERPADLLFQVGGDFLKRDKLREAFSRFDLLIKNYPDDRNAPYAYQMKGQIFFKQERYPEAVEMFSSALRYTLTRGRRTKILMDKARALVECSMHKEALKAVRKVEREIRGSAPYHSHIYEELGDLYLHLDSPKEALSAFTSAISMETDDAVITMLKFRVAECYNRMGGREDSLDLYEQIVNRDEPFWSNLASERIVEIEFAGALHNTGK
jgi:tetratricopeptide (TPR) repeat protein